MTSIWKQPTLITGEQTFEMKITEKDGKGRISRTVIVQNGKVIEKPSDVNILGDNTFEGFIVSGLEIIRKRKQRMD
jgi:hypothetical protein